MKRKKFDGKVETIAEFYHENGCAIVLWDGFRFVIKTKANEKVEYGPYPLATFPYSRISAIKFFHQVCKSIKEGVKINERN